MSKPHIVVVIPARGGSKSIPRKNIRNFAGHPLIAYPISAALAAKHVDRVILSTDDEEIAAVGRRYGAETPFLRPAEFAQDDTRDGPVYQHALDWLTENSQAPDIMVQLRPTAPLLPKGMIDAAIELFLENPDYDSLRSTIPAPDPPFKMWRLKEDGKTLVPVVLADVYESYNAPRQELPAAFLHSAHIDVFSAKTMREKNSITGDKVLAFPVDRRFTADIDTMLDWYNAQAVFAGVAEDIVMPPESLKEGYDLARTKLVVLDFDGVLTDNRVLVLQDGTEAVIAHRGDGHGIGQLKKQGVDVMVISAEVNPVVAARCKKLDIPCIHGVQDKLPLLKAELAKRGIDAADTIYVGNDTADAACMRHVGLGVAVADAHESAKEASTLILENNGGFGAVRELCDRIITALEK